MVERDRLMASMVKVQLRLLCCYSLDSNPLLKGFTGIMEEKKIYNQWQSFPAVGESVTAEQVYHQRNKASV